MHIRQRQKLPPDLPSHHAAVPSPVSASATLSYRWVLHDFHEKLAAPPPLPEHSARVPRLLHVSRSAHLLDPQGASAQRERRRGASQNSVIAPGWLLSP